MPNQMSGGQQQRVGIARALVVRPRIIFADEPTGNLDSKTTLEVLKLMQKIVREQNQTLVMVTHDNHLATYADRIFHIIDGKIFKIETDHVRSGYGADEPEKREPDAAKAERPEVERLEANAAEAGKLEPDGAEVGKAEAGETEVGKIEPDKAEAGKWSRMRQNRMKVRKERARMFDRAPDGEE